MPRMHARDTHPAVAALFFVGTERNASPSCAETAIPPSPNEHIRAHDCVSPVFLHCASGRRQVRLRCQLWSWQALCGSLFLCEKPMQTLLQRPKRRSRGGSRRAFPCALTPGIICTNTRHYLCEAVCTITHTDIKICM